MFVRDGKMHFVLSVKPVALGWALVGSARHKMSGSGSLLAAFEHVSKARNLATREARDALFASVHAMVTSPAGHAQEEDDPVGQLFNAPLCGCR